MLLQKIQTYCKSKDIIIDSIVCLIFEKNVMLWQVFAASFNLFFFLSCSLAALSNRFFTFLVISICNVKIQ